MDSSGHRSVPIFVLVLLILLGLFLIATPAFADGMGVVYGPVSYGNMFDENYDCSVAVYAENKYDAALYACGYDPNGSAITSDVKAYLSNASTGGAFYSFAQSFENHNNPSDFSNLVGGTGDTGITRGVVSMLNEQYGASNVWIASYESQERTGAIASVALVLAGDIPNTGGGSGGGSDGSLTYVLSKQSPDITTRWFYVNNPKEKVLYADAPSTMTVTIEGNIVNSINSAIEDNYDVLIYADTTNAAQNFAVYPYLYVYCFPSGQYTLSKYTYGDNQYDYLVNSVTGKTTYMSSVIYNRTSSGFDFTYTDNNVLNNSTRSGNFAINSTITSSVSYYGGYFVWIPSSGTPSTPQNPSTPTVPPTDWPEPSTPSTPTQPEVPNAPTGGTPPQLTNPTTYPSDTTVINNTYTVDIQGILDAMADHCQHIRDSIYKNCKMVYEGITDYMQDLAEWWSGVIDDEFDNLCDYLQDLFDWLADQFDFSVSGTGYDDNTVVSWLRRIYYKLGTGTNTKPSDPAANPFDIGQWLSTLFGNLFTALNDLAGGLLSDIADWVSALSSKFPFSLPFDIAFILGLLVADPVAPNFDVPMYTLNAGGGLVEVGMIEVDLADWSQYLEGVRFMIKVCFVMFLAMHTKDFMELMEKAVGLGA